MRNKIRRAPCLIQAEEFKHWDVEREIEGMWVRNRPLTLDTLRSRLRLAWGVFKGKYDALEWYKQ